MNEAQRMAEVEKFKNYFSYINRPGADKLLAWLEEAGFFTAPASTKYHGAYAGGLVEHTNHVYRRLVRLADEEDKRQGRTYPEYTVDTIAVAALLHDVCKVDAYKVEKKNQKQKDGSWKEVEVYGYTNSLPLGHGEKSIIQIMRYMQLTEEEMLAIRWHMGAFDSAVKGGSYDMNNAFAGSRNQLEAANLKRQGVKAGVPDLCLPVARNGKHGLYVEMKWQNNKTTEKQDWWLEQLRQQGYETAVCWSAEEAMDTIAGYLGVMEQTGRKVEL